MSAPAAAASGAKATSLPRADLPLAARQSAFAPLLPVALAVTAGIVLDRYAELPLTLLLVGLAWSLLLRIGFWGGRHDRGAFWCSLLLAGVLGATWHHLRQQPPVNDLRNLPVNDVPLARLRGVVLDVQIRLRPDDALRSLPAGERTVLLVRATGLRGAGDWLPVCGRCRVSVPERVDAAAAGDEVEVTGEVHRVLSPANPGEADIDAYFRDQGIGAILLARSSDAVRVVRTSLLAWPDSLLARMRRWAAEQLDQALPPGRAALARALLLGDQAALATGQFEGFQRTGVYHILAISGQHLAILCALLWPALRLLPLARGRRALLLAGAVLLYALLTGGRPPILRAAVMVCTFCGGLLVRRPTQPLNSLALAWLLVAMLNPADIFQTGCQISFLCVLVLIEVIAPWETAWAPREPLDKLRKELRPFWQRLLLVIGRWFLMAFICGAVLWLVVTPLTAARYHLVSPVAILLGPPLIVLSSVALVAGFLFLVLAPFGGLLTWPFVAIMELSLGGCEGLVLLADRLPLAYWHTPGPPGWWLLVFYGGLLLWILVPGWRARWRPALLAGLVWLCVLLLLPSHRPAPGELRCTILAVGHGSCAVLELPDGRVLLYDAGSITGPEVTQRHIAPFLWQRGIRRLDEVYLSHADLDHFNGLPDLLDRFGVSQVSVTPSFFAKHERGNTRVADELATRRVPVRTLSAGQVLRAGEASIEVLHPPPLGPEGTENARSLVLLFRHEGQTLLLTGDLEEPGLGVLLARRAPSVDVLLAPHHGSAASNTERFAAWARPRLVISSEGRERGRRVDPYTLRGAQLWRTAREGAVTIHISQTGVWAETFRTRQQWGAKKAAE